MTVAADSAHAEFSAYADRYRRELHVHCYRMLASFDDAEDAVQESLLRAWRGWDGFEPSDGGTPRGWLYRIATNVCLDQLRQKARRPTEASSVAEVPWLQPYPDVLLDQVASGADEPDEVAVRRETIELAFLAAMQVLPPRQRAALIARDVLGWPAADTAEPLQASVAAVNSALQRARATMAGHLPAERSHWSAGQPSAAERDLLARFIDAHQRGDAELAVTLAARDIRITMPPYPHRFDGIADLQRLLDRAFGPDREGDWRLVPAWANRMPAAASYLRRFGDTRFRGLKLDVLRLEAGKIAEITTFGPALFPAFGLPAELDSPDA